MKLLFDFFPVLFFFIVYKLAGIYIAALAAIGIAFIQVIYTAVRYKRCEPMQWITLTALTFLSGASLWFHNELFIKFKPTLINGIFGAGFFLSEFIGKKKPFIQRIMEERIELPADVWRRLNRSWALFFVSMAAVNVYVVYHFDTNTWVNFKLFGMLGFTVLFTVLQAVYLARHIKNIDIKP